MPTANLGLRIVLRTIDGNCIKAVGDSMGLDREQREYLPQLPERKAIVHYKGYPDPFLIEIPQLDFYRRISEAEIRQRMAPVLSSLKWKPSKRNGTASEKIILTAPVAEERERTTDAGLDNMPVNEAINAKPSPNNMTSLTNSSWMTKQLMDYLIEIANSPFEPATKRDERLGLSGYKGDRHRSELAEKEMIRMHKINTGKRGGMITLLEATDKAYEYLESIKAKVTKPRGKGGFIHAYWQHCIAESLRKNAEVWIEDSRSGKLVDVGAKMDGKNVAIEIALEGEEKELVNVAKDSDFYDRIIILTEKQKTSDSLRAKLDNLGKEFSEKVEIVLLRSFINNDEDDGENEGGENRLTQILTPSPEDKLSLKELRARDDVIVEDKQSEEVGKKRKEKEETEPETENRNKWQERIWYCLKNLDDLIALNSSSLTRLAYIERIAKNKYKNEGLPKAKLLRDILNLCIDRLIQELENDNNSVKIAGYLKLAKKGLNNSQIAKELGLTREHVSRVYRNKSIELVTQEFLSTVGHSNLVFRG